MVRIHDVLRAASVLARQSSVELALQTGIRRSRIGRVLSGRTLPKGDEPERILEACGVSRRLLTSPVSIRFVGDAAKVVQRGSLRATQLQPADLLLGILLHREANARDTATKVDGRLSVDKLSLTFNTTNEKEFLATASSLGSKIPIRNSTYAHDYRCGSVLVQHGLPPNPPKRFKNRRSSRVEINPCGLFASSPSARLDRYVLLSLLKIAERASIRVTRIDLAVDLPVSLQRVQPLGSEQQKVNFWFGQHGVETIYLGKRNAECQLRVYDRRRKLIEDGFADADHPNLTRFEAQLRNVGLGVDSLDRLVNPFEKLQLFDLRPDSLPLMRRVLVGYARAFSLPAFRRETNRAAYRVLARDLESASSTPQFTHPRDVFELQWPVQIRPLQRLLRNAVGP